MKSAHPEKKNPGITTREFRTNFTRSRGQAQNSVVTQAQTSGAYSEECWEFIQAIDKARKQAGRKTFPASDIYQVVKALGYTKEAKCLQASST